MGLHRSPYLLKRPLLDLADAFAGYSIFRSKLFKRRRLVRQPARREDATFTRVKLRDGAIKGLTAPNGTPESGSDLASLKGRLTGRGALAG